MGDRTLEYMPLSAIQPALRNAKNHAEPQISAGINQFGLGELPLLDERTGRLVAGHGRRSDLIAKRDAGENPPDGIRVDPDSGDWLVPIIRGWSSRSDAEAAAAGVAFNRIGQNGGWDLHQLDEMLTEIGATDPDLVALTGVDLDELADLLKAAEPPDLDKLADDLGDPDPSDTWPTVRVRVPHHVAAAWREYLSTYNDKEVPAFAALLDVDPEPPPASAWAP